MRFEPRLRALDLFYPVDCGAIRVKRDQRAVPRAIEALLDDLLRFAFASGRQVALRGGYGECRFALLRIGQLAQRFVERAPVERLTPYAFGERVRAQLG